MTRTSPIGSSVLAVLAGLHDRYRFVVVAAYFENPSPDTIEHVRVRLPRVPTFVKELCWPTIAGVGFRRRRLGRIPGRGDAGDAGAAPRSGHRLRPLLPPGVSAASTSRSRARAGFVGSAASSCTGTARISSARPSGAPASSRCRRRDWPARSSGRIPSPPRRSITFRTRSTPRGSPARSSSTVPRHEPSSAFARTTSSSCSSRSATSAARASRSACAGSPQRRRAMRASLVVGGTKGEIGVFQGIAAAAGIADDVRFVGLQQDVRPYLWLSDAFLFPTIYEAASKAVLQAAAAGLPIIAPRINGIEDVIEHGVNGWFAERTPEGFADAIRTSLDGAGRASGDGRPGAARRRRQRHPVLRPALGRAADQCPS